MFDWKTVALTCGLINAICVVLDRWILPTGKSRIQVWLLGIFIALEKSTVHSLPRLMAIHARRLWFRFFGFEFWSWQSISRVVAFSFCLTITAILGGRALQDWVINLSAQASSDDTILVSTSIHPIEWTVLLLINLLFDLSTVHFTLFVLRRLSGRIHSVKAMAWIALDVVIAFSFGALCIWMMMQLFMFRKDGCV